MVRLGASAKCNDVTSIWNCSNDKTQAFRCVAAKVTVELCDGAGACEAKPVGQDDVCHTKPASTPPSSPGPSPADPTGTPSDQSPPQTNGATVSEVSGDDPSSEPEASGCNVSSRAGGGGLGSALLLLVGALVMTRATRTRMRA
jgi:hypothetical protein